MKVVVKLRSLQSVRKVVTFLEITEFISSFGNTITPLSIANEIFVLDLHMEVEEFSALFDQKYKETFGFLVNKYILLPENVQEIIENNPFKEERSDLFVGLFTKGKMFDKNIEEFENPYPGKLKFWNQYAYFATHSRAEANKMMVKVEKKLQKAVLISYNKLESLNQELKQ